MRRTVLAAAFVLVMATAASAADSVEELIAKIGSPDTAVRMEAVRTLGRRGPEADAAAPKLRELIADPEAGAELRLASFDALRKMAVGLGPSIAPLVSLLSHDDAVVRADAAAALGRSGTGDAAAISGLAGALGDRDEEVRYCAALALGEIGPKAKAALDRVAARAADEDESPDVRDAAREAARRIRRTAPPRKAEPPRPTPTKPGGNTNETGFDGLREDLASEGAVDRLRALGTIAVLGRQCRSLIHDIARQFRHADADVRLAALRALETIGPDAAPVISEVAARLRDSDPEVKRQAKKTLIALGARISTGVPTAPGAKPGGRPPPEEPAGGMDETRWKFLYTAGKAATDSRDYETAESKLRAALALAAGFGPADRRLGDTQRALGIVLDVKQEYEEALELFEGALAIREEIGSDDPVDDAWLHHSIGSMHRRLGNYDHAELSAHRSLDLLKRHGPSRVRDRCRFQEALASVYLQTDRFDEAEELLLATLRDIREEYGDSDATSGRLYNSLASLYRRQEKYEQAELYFRQARDSWVESQGADHWWIGLADQNLGLILTDQGKTALAAKMYERAVGIFRKALGWNHAATLSGVEDLADALRATGREDEASAWDARAARIRDALGR